MAELFINSTRISGEQEPVTATLTVADTLVWQPSQTVVAHLDNVTAGVIVVTLSGDASALVTCSGLGDPIDVSGGYAISIPAGEKRFILLSSIEKYLQGNISVASDSGGVEATLYQL